jgi:hypothetical protein
MYWEEQHPRLGTEFDWLAVDDAECVGFFSTAGFGAIPRWLLADAAQQQTEDLIGVLRTLPTRPGNPVVRPDRFNRDDWIEVSRRGVFAYDWSHETDAYEIISSPVAPLRLADIHDIQSKEFLRRCRIDGMFSEMKEIRPSEDGRPA